MGGRAFSLRYLSAALPNLVARLFISSGAPDLGFSVVHRREKSCAKKVAQFACIDPTDAPLAKTVPGLRRYEVSTGPVTTSAGDSAYHLVAVPEFNSLQALQRGLESTEGQATAGDLTNFAQARVELLMFDIKAV